MPVERKIIHVDMDAFYASIEQHDNPAYRGKPIIVGGTPDSRGVVAAASYEARAFKVRSAMSCAKAARLCPQAIFVPPRFTRYREVSQKMMAILREATDQIEPLALDEAYLDVTENKLQESSATRVAVYLKSRIKGQLGITASAGVAPNKFLAKLASEMQKPNGLVVIPPSKIEETVRELDIEKLWGIGPATASKLRARGWNTTADLRRLSPEILSSVLGKSSSFIFRLAHGEDTRLVHNDRELKSRGAETTFEKDTQNLEELEENLLRLTERVTRSLSKLELFGRTITLKLRYSDFTTLSRSKTLESGTQDTTLVYEIARGMMRHTTEAGKRPVRLIGVSVSGFDAPQEPDQLSLPIS